MRLQDQLKELRRTTFDAIADGKKLEKVQKKIAELQEGLADMKKKVDKGENIESEALTKAREQLSELKKQAKVDTDIIDLETQLKTGDFKIPEVKTEKILPQRLQGSLIQRKRLRQRVRERLEELKPRPKGAARFGKVVTETKNTLMTAKTMLDMSAMFRQGLPAVVSNPKAFPKAFKDAALSAFSKSKAEQVDLALRSSDMQLTRDVAGLELTEMDGKLTAREELFADNLIEKVWGLKHIKHASERHFVTFLNIMRAEAFDGFVRRHPNATPTELAAWADVINVGSGRGRLNSFSGAGKTLSHMLFAPKFTVSRFQYIDLLRKYRKEPRIRKEIAKQQAAVAATGASLLGIAALAGFDVDLDKRSPRFGTITKGDTHIDFWAGFRQPALFALRIGVLASDRLGFSGEDLTEFEKDFDITAAFGRQLEYKLNPILTSPIELIRGKTLFGDETTPLATLERAAVPIIAESTYEAYVLADKEATAITGVGEFIGFAVNTYAKSEKRVRAEALKLREKGLFIESDALVSKHNENNPINPIVNLTSRKETLRNERQLMVAKVVAEEVVAASKGKSEKEQQRLRDKAQKLIDDWNDNPKNADNLIDGNFLGKKVIKLRESQQKELAN